MQMVGFILLFGALPLHTVSWQFVLDTKWDILPLLDLWWELLMHFVTSTCTKMLNNTTKERQKPKKHNMTSSYENISFKGGILQYVLSLFKCILLILERKRTKEYFFQLQH